MSIRLNKLLAQRGVAARRKCDELIEQGRVRVNGQTVRELGTTVDPDRDRIEVAGRPLPRAAERRYFVLNKPVGIITTLEDPEGRRTIREFLPPGARLFPVGRLDADTSGLLLLTDDGDLAHKLMHPRYGVEKVYRAWLEREPSEAQLDRLRHGVEFEPGLTSAPARVRKLTVDRRGLVEIAIHEGRYRQVRRMFEAVGLEVTGLHRSAYGPLRLGPLPRGMWRELSEAEVARLRAASARAVPRSGPARRGSYFSARRGIVPQPPRGELEHGMPERSGRPRDRRGAARGERGPDRREGFQRGERPERQRSERGSRFERPGRGERVERAGNAERFKRAGNAERFERAGNAERFERAGNADRFERPGNADRVQRPSRRGERPERGQRFERPGRGERASRPGGSERRGRDERAPRPGGGKRSERGERFEPFDRFAPERTERARGERSPGPRRGVAPRGRTEGGVDRAPSRRPAPRGREGRPDLGGGRSGRGERERTAPPRRRFDRPGEAQRGRPSGERDRFERPGPRRYGDRPARPSERDRPRTAGRERVSRFDRSERAERGGPRPGNRFQRGGPAPAARSRQPFAGSRGNYGPPKAIASRKPARGPARPPRGGRGMGGMARPSAKTRRPGSFRRPRRPSEGE